MVKIFKAKPKPIKKRTVTLTISELSLDGDGIGFIDRKPVIVAGALPGERVSVRIDDDKRRSIKASLMQVLDASEQRVEPFCAHFEQCGGCNLQYLSSEHQLAAKTAALKSYLTRQLPEASPTWMPPLTSADRHYRRRAKLACRVNRTNAKLEIGFRGKQSNHICTIEHCPVLAEPLATIPAILQTALAQQTDVKRFGHIDLLALENDVVVLIRVTQALTAKQKTLLTRLAETHQWRIGLQMDDKSVQWLDGEAFTPTYALPEFDLHLNFSANGFIQVNEDVNRKMIAQAINWLAIEADDTLLDLYCGIGNFTLPMATLAKQVVGVEGADELVAQARSNAIKHDLSNVSFYAQDLTQDLSRLPFWTSKSANKLLLDPARAGAYELVQQIRPKQFERILYVSCNPQSMLRDAAELEAKGYRLQQIGVMDMFPQTGHLEAMALFV